MAKTKNTMIGNRYARLMVISEALLGKNLRYFNCVCDCGAQTVVCITNLTSGHTKSCGCLRKELTAENRRTHGETVDRKPTTEYVIWLGMIARCESTSDNNYCRYGARGIKVCERWHAFENFLADMGRRPIGKSIERNYNNGYYEPSNCRWATRVEQNRNKRNNVLLTMERETLSVAEWAERLNIPCFTLYSRIKRGWSAERALRTLPRC